MNEFHFGRQMEICGHVYDADFGNQNVQSKLKNLSTEIKENSDNQQRVTDICRAAIDSILGEGSFDEIFRGRVVRLADITHLLQFLASEGEAEQRGE